MDTSPAKTCTSCTLTKPLSEFSKVNGGRIGSRCRKCANAKALEAKYRRDPRERRPRRAAEQRFADGLASCLTCGEFKPLDQFRKSDAPAGITSRCKPCLNLRACKKRWATGQGRRAKFATDDLQAGVKTCRRCLKPLPVEEFDRSKSGSYAPRCRPCGYAYLVERVGKEVLQARRSASRAKSPEKYKLSKRQAEHLRRARAQSTGGNACKATLACILLADSCTYCGHSVPADGRTADHIVPLCSGGRHEAENLVMACRSCNFRKQGMSLERFQLRLNQQPIKDNDDLLVL